VKIRKKQTRSRSFQGLQGSIVASFARNLQQSRGIGAAWRARARAGDATVLSAITRINVTCKLISS